MLGFSHYIYTDLECCSSKTQCQVSYTRSTMSIWPAMLLIAPSLHFQRWDVNNYWNRFPHLEQLPSAGLLNFMERLLISKCLNLNYRTHCQKWIKQDLRDLCYCGSPCCCWAYVMWYCGTATQRRVQVTIATEVTTECMHLNVSSYPACMRLAEALLRWVGSHKWYPYIPCYGNY